MEEVNQRAITPGEVEEQIQLWEKRLETLSGDEAKRLRKTIDQFKAQVVGMRTGRIKVFQRIPQKINQ